MIDSPSPSFEVALQEEFKRFYLAGIETGRKRTLSELEKELLEAAPGIGITDKDGERVEYDLPVLEYKARIEHIITKYKNGVK